jgi:hypothetical protein
MKASSNRPLELARRHGPTLAVLLALAALAWWGHRSGWKMPRLSAIRDGAEPGAAEDWCALHNVPESKCIGSATTGRRVKSRRPGGSVLDRH